jgi:protein involved in polysaccharide export with SLBB domain
MIPFYALLLSIVVVTSAAAETQPYRLEAGDAVEVRFFYTPELNDKFQIRPDGKTSLGLIGEVTAAGKTIPELTKELEKRYVGQLKNPSISVQVLSFANRKVFVGGEVVRPGLISLLGEQTVLGAILESGGLTKTAVRSNVLVIRRSDSGAPETFRLSMERKGEMTSQASSFLLRPFDVVLVSETRIARMNRAVDQYVFKFIPPQLTFGFTYLLNNTGVIF